MSYSGMEIAVVGMACRFPKSRNIREFWDHIRAGNELVTHFSEEDLRTFGIDPKMSKDPGYVAAEAIIEDPGEFDASFFKIAESDSVTMDPQQRILLECAWHALEDGGYAPDQQPLNCGVFVSGGNNKYYLQNVLSNPDKVEEVGDFQIEIGNSVNFLATRISYLFNLTGPASVVQTACSSSLVAIHYACQSLLNGECDLALSGGSKIEVPQNYGHIHTEGGVKSKEGHCRVFDEGSSGFVNGSGCGLVLLKRLEDAIESGDEIYGIVKGSALNNDGSEKIGYTAPSIPGQKQVIKEALEIAEVAPETISYIEAHGTGTKLGDPIEIDGLKQVFTSKIPHCALGSVKANMGHLDAAAGVAGFIKAILTLHHKEICPQINFNQLNPAIQLEGSPFYISTSLKPWSNKEKPFRAGVSSFGIGGTNAHIVLEEAPVKNKKASPQSPLTILVNSAKSEESLINYQAKLAAWIDPDLSLEALAYSSWNKRPQFQYRSALVADHIETLREKLKQPQDVTLAIEKPKVYFLFPGQGSQYTHMTRELYDHHSSYRQHLDKCLDTLQELSDSNFKGILFSESSDDRIHETQYAQPLIFSVEYALAQMLADLGVKPDAMIGHSLGEITAACIAGTMSLKESLELVLIRSRLMQSMPRGSMVSVSLNGERRFLDELPETLCIAAINSEANYVISGDTSAVTSLEEELSRLNVKHRRLKTSHAYHSHMMQGMLEEFETSIQPFAYQAPSVPFVSNLTGSWIQGTEINPNYWKDHVENPVRFLDGIRLLDEESAVFIEVGPGGALSYLTRQTWQDPPTINLVPANEHEPAPLTFLYEGLSKLWEQGVTIDLGALISPQTSRLRLPGYAFDHKNYWLPVSENPLKKAQKSEELTYEPYWKSLRFERGKRLSGKACLLFANNPSKILLQELQKVCENLIIVQPGKRFKARKHAFQIDVADPSQFEQLFTELRKANLFPSHIIHGLSLTTKTPESSINQADSWLEKWYYSLLNLCRTLEPHLQGGISLDVLTNDVFTVLGNEVITPLKATLLGPVKVAPLEFDGLISRLIEFSTDDWQRDARSTSKNLIDFIQSDHQPEMKSAALRGSSFWEQSFQGVKQASKEAPFRRKGSYLITGGFGGMGSSIAIFLAKEYRARIALFTSSPIPSEDQWSTDLVEKDRKKVDLLKEIKSLGGEVRPYAVDISDHPNMQLAISDILSEWGEINGVIHTAGIADFGGILSKRNNESIMEVLKPKIHGHLILREITKQLSLDFFINFSSIGNQVYGKKFGQIAYNTANEYLDVCAGSHEKTISWCDWLDVGMAYNAVKKKNDLTDSRQINAKVLHSIKPEMGVSLFQRVLASDQPHTLISPIYLPDFIKESNHRETADNSDLTTEKTAYSRQELQDKLAALYQSFFGLEDLDLHTDFSDLGGDSLKAVVLLSRIKKKLKLPLTLSEFYEHSSVAALASLLAMETQDDLVPINTENFLLLSGEHQLFGTRFFSTSKSKTPIIICPPILQEEIIANRAMDTLSEQLAIQHAPVVRFDFAGMGNSEGDELQLDLSIWSQNLEDVIKDTQQQFSNKRVHLVGLRMGATLINAFWDQFEKSVEQTLFWHPITEGSTYLKELDHYQHLFVKGSFADQTSLQKDQGMLEFNSYRVPNSICKSISSLRFDPSKHQKNSTLIASQESHNLMSADINMSFFPSESPPFWNKLASDKGYVPERDIEQITAWQRTL